MNYLVEKDWTTKEGHRAVVIVCKNGERRTHRCGYVGVTKDSIFYKQHYSKPMPQFVGYAEKAIIGQKSPIIALTAGVNTNEGETVRSSPDTLIDCHGGLTFSEGGNDYPVKSDLWWFGFDCHHYRDGEIEPDERFGHDHYPVRSLSFCVNQCESISHQLAEFEPSKPSTP